MARSTSRIASENTRGGTRSSGAGPSSPTGVNHTGPEEQYDTDRCRSSSRSTRFTTKVACPSRPVAASR